MGGRNQWKRTFRTRSGLRGLQGRKRIFGFFRKYTGADIVPQLIDQHRLTYDEADLDFICLDPIDEELPGAGVVLVRQVLQHLTNEQIAKITFKLSSFTHPIVTEHLPSPGRLGSKNDDKVHGGGIRVARGSGVYLEDPPFSLGFVESKVLAEVPGGGNPIRDGMIVTTWYRMR